VIQFHIFLPRSRGRWPEGPEGGASDGVLAPPLAASRHSPRKRGEKGILAATLVGFFLLVAPAHATDVTAHVIPLYPDRPNDRRDGQLIYRGGLELTSSDNRFGGLSDISVSADGERILAVSDEAFWFRARLSYDPVGNLTGVHDAEIAPMLNLTGAAMQEKEGDAEGLAAEVPGEPWGAVLVSFERDHRVWRYDLAHGLSAEPEPVPMGSWIQGLLSNEGLEGIALLPHDTLLALSEHTLDDDGNIMAGLEPYPATVAHGGYGQLSVRPHGSFSVTSAAPDGDGGVFILERRFSLLGGLGMELRHVAPAELRPGAVIEGIVIANLAAGDANIDNMEGLAVRHGAHGETYLYVISDDNYNALQRTVLLMFELSQ